MAHTFVTCTPNLCGVQPGKIACLVGTQETKGWGADLDYAYQLMGKLDITSGFQN